MILEDFSPMHKEQQIRVISGVRKEAGQVVLSGLSNHCVFPIVLMWKDNSKIVERKR